MLYFKKMAYLGFIVLSFLYSADTDRQIRSITDFINAHEIDSDSEVERSEYSPTLSLSFDNITAGSSPEIELVTNQESGESYTVTYISTLDQGTVDYSNLSIDDNVGDG